MLHFYGPGFKNLENAVRSYLQRYKYGGYALAMNPQNNKWYVVIVHY